jgi:hypothetical protein
MCSPVRGIDVDAFDEKRDACDQGQVLEDTDPAVRVGCRQLREARNE